MSKSFIGKEVSAVVRPGFMAAEAPFTIVQTVVCDTDEDGNNILCLLRHTNEEGQHVWALSSGAEDGLDDEDSAFAGQAPIGMTDGKGVPPMLAAALRELADKVDALAAETTEE